MGEGDALQLSPDPVEDYVILGTAADLNFGADQDFSISLWVQSSGTPDWGALISNKDWGSGGNVGWGLFDYQGPIDWNFSDGSARDDLYIPQIYDGQWHHITVTNDRDDLASIYLDGILVTSASIASATGTIDSGNAVRIGIDGVGNYPFEGAIDDVQIFDFALNKNGVAEVFAAGGGEGICLDRPELDLDLDCVIGLGDIALLLTEWLDCGLHPSAECP